MEYFITRLHSHIFDPDRIPYAVLAVLLTMIIGIATGPFRGNANPLIWLIFDGILGKTGDRLDHEARDRKDLIFRGLLVTVLAVVAGALLGLFYARIVYKMPFYGMTEIVLLCTVISSGTVWFALLRLYFALEKGEVGKGAYFAISRSSRTNLALADDFGITRTGMGFAARAFDRGLVGPIFWYLVAGLPGAAVYAALAAMAWRFGKDGFSRGFGEVPLALEKLMGFAPSLFAALLITLAGVFTPTAKVERALSSWTSRENRAPHEQGGYPLTVLAWALNVSLGGASQDLEGSALRADWVGPPGATARNDHSHLRRAIYISGMAHILLLASLVGAYMWSFTL